MTRSRCRPEGSRCTDQGRVRSVVLIDDDRAIAHGCALRLRAAGYVVTPACTGAGGLERVLAEPPDVLVLDVRMPDLDGLEVLARLRQQAQTRDLPVVMLSANVAEPTKSAARDLGARWFVEKPYRPAELVRAIELALDDAEGGGEGEGVGCTARRS